MRNAGAWHHGVESGQCAIHLIVELTSTVNAPSVRRACVDRGLLLDPLTSAAWGARQWQRMLAYFEGSITAGGKQAAALQVPQGAIVAAALQVLRGAMVAAAKQVLMSDGRQPGWLLRQKLH